MPKPNLSLILKLITILLSALALKYHYSTASVNDLRWILAPTTFIVEIVTGVRFAFEPYAGYMSADNTFLIAASCSGVNFLLIAFLLLTLARLWRERDMKWTALPAAAAVAYAATLVANTTRIVLAMWLQKTDLSISGLNPDELHRIEGIVVYFGFLLLLFLATEKRYVLDTLKVGRLKYLLAVYYGVTLGIPLVRGGYGDAAFWQHSMYVVLVPMTVVLPIAIYILARRGHGEAQSKLPGRA